MKIIIPKKLIMLGIDDNNHALIAYYRMHGLNDKIYLYTCSGEDFEMDGKYSNKCSIAAEKRTPWEESDIIIHASHHAKHMYEKEKQK